MHKTRVDDMLMEMIQPKVAEIEKKFNSGEGLTQEDINTLLLKSQYNHINHLDEKLDEVTADVASLKGEFQGVKGDFQGLKGDFQGLKGEFQGLKGEFQGLKGEFELLRVSVNERLNTFEERLMTFEANLSLKISEAINTNMRFSIGLIAFIVTVLKLADMFVK